MLWNILYISLCVVNPPSSFILLQHVWKGFWYLSSTICINKLYMIMLVCVRWYYFLSLISFFFFRVLILINKLQLCFISSLLSRPSLFLVTRGKFISRHVSNIIVQTKIYWYSANWSILVFNPKQLYANKDSCQRTFMQTSSGECSEQF